MGTSPGSTDDVDATASVERYATVLERAARGRHLGAVLATAARRTVTATEATDETDRAKLDVAAGVAGPCIVAYAGWVLAAAQQSGIDRLYFVAREGEVLLRVARALQDRLGAAPDTELRYVHGSRVAWQLPAYGLAGGLVLEWLLADAQETTLADLVGRVGIPLDDEIRRASGVPPSLGDDARLRGLAGRVGRNLATSAAFRSRLQARAAETRDVTLAYLEQEQVFAHGSVGFVDTGWSGRQFRALDLLLHLRDPARTPAYFLYALVKTASVAPERTTCFVADARRRPLVESEAARFGELIESVCAGREGSTVGYARRDGAVVPVLARSRNEPALQWGLDRYRVHLDGFVTNVCDLLAPLGLPRLTEFEATVPALEGVLKEFWFHPTPAEAHTWGSLRDADHGSADWAERAPTVRWGDLIPWVTNRRWVRWPYAAAVTSPQPLATVIRWLANLLRVVVRLRAVARGAASWSKRS